MVCISLLDEETHLRDLVENNSIFDSIQACNGLITYLTIWIFDVCMHSYKENLSEMELDCSLLQWWCRISAEQISNGSFVWTIKIIKKFFVSYFPWQALYFVAVVVLYLDCLFITFMISTCWPQSHFHSPSILTF